MTRDRCDWTLDTDEWNGDSWDTECGEKFVFIDGGPVKNNMRYCCHCGLPLNEVRPVESPSHE